ncbi:MAG: type 4a pilus biogenesis protein PilO [Gammaproteobacteria bacterium]|nr:type 4a pilus biogenesis protein PilO [Gammaproteobacteria bacterium]MCP4089946.1 type 4a pilus biogenesis protein PilO [Gammaproteobacteria bacterium]MCP4276277.1 type 4a pilus biogenesis protein PilO [Gammaproteobacteria bacterium]MCP4831272.1 type 4a pilus biogenesis protein PilO [Gammaproteobacteria bacterium]MCP4928755.1 type 4a pilus biogenesis protein PilO [Gammaproteobacteria bacterium]
MNNFLEEIQSLDPNDIGRWPFLFRASAVAVVAVVAMMAGLYLFVYEEKIPVLEKAQSEEQELRVVFEAKQKKASNFDAYQTQLAEIERSFGTMLQQLPGKTEIPNLLVDISQTGLAAGLKEKLFQPENENRRDFYAEKPIKIRLEGGYHEFGNFVSDIAALPRIVTLHDIQIIPASKDASNDELILTVVAKTYRYMDEEEVMKFEAEGKKGRKGKKKRKRG